MSPTSSVDRRSLDPLAALKTVDAQERIAVLVTRMQFASGKSNGAPLAHMIRVKWRDVFLLSYGS